MEPDLTLPGHPEIQVIGDLAALEQDGRPVPGVVSAAVQQGRHAAESARRVIAAVDSRGCAAPILGCRRDPIEMKTA